MHQSVLISSTVLLSWLGMMVVHEFGHVLGAWCSGGEVARVVLHPLVISRTDLTRNPHPLFVAWSGPVFGVVAPVLAWLAGWRIRGGYVVRFFAGFCLVANGAYIGVGSFERVGDAGDLIRHGAAMWQLWLFGLVSCPAGLVLWHRLGRHFGLGQPTGQVDGTVACVILVLLIVLIVSEVALVRL
jgi:hypothetical protein